MSIAVVGAVSLAGPILLLGLSRHGIHATNDSFTYLGAAVNLAHGKGWTYPFANVGAPVTLFPPVYPIALAIPNLLGVDVLHWVIWQNAVLFGASSFIVGLTVLRASEGSVGAALVAVSMTILGRPLVLVFSLIWSETIFLSLEIIAMAFLARFVKTRSTRDLIVAAGATSLAMLTRYAGLSLFLTGCAIVAIWPGGAVRARLRSLAMYIAISLALNLAWAVRNLLESTTLTGSNALVHSLAGSQVVDGLRVVRTWFLRTSVPGRFGSGIVLLVGLAAVVVLAIVRLFRRSTSLRIRIPALAVVSLLLALLHFLFIVAANRFSSRAPPFNDRILGPMYVPLVIAAVLIGQALWRSAAPYVRALRAALVVVAASLIAMAALASGPYMTGLFGASADSADQLATLSRQLRGYATGAQALYSNQANRTWFAVGRPVSSLPKSCLGGGHQPNPAYDAELFSLGQQLQNRSRVVFVFIRSRSCKPFSVGELEFQLGLAREAFVQHVLVLNGAQG